MRYLIIICLLFSACAGDQRPKGVLSQDEMQAVLYDVIQGDEMVDFLKLGDSTYQPFSRRTAIYDTIFQLHGINKETFQQSMQYYQGRPDLLKNIFEKLHETAAADTGRKKLQPAVY